MAYQRKTRDVWKEIAKKIENKAREITLLNNPYIKSAIKYAIGNTPMYLYEGKALNREGIDEAYFNTALKDIQKGYEERMAGYYDKWYREARADEGTAYDAGQRMATDSEKCPAEFHIIKCEHHKLS